jgi:hypothetical protein
MFLLTAPKWYPIQLGDKIKNVNFYQGVQGSNNKLTKVESKLEEKKKIIQLLKKTSGNISS